MPDSQHSARRSGPSDSINRSHSGIGLTTMVIMSLSSGGTMQLGAKRQQILLAVKSTFSAGLVKLTLLAALFLMPLDVFARNIAVDEAARLLQGVNVLKRYQKYQPTPADKPTKIDAF